MVISQCSLLFMLASSFLLQRIRVSSLTRKDFDYLRFFPYLASPSPLHILFIINVFYLIHSVSYFSVV